MKTVVYLAMGLLAACSTGAMAQTSTANPRGSTTVGRSEYATGHGALHRKPRNYDNYYYSRNNGYVLSPYLVTTPQNMKRVVQPVRPYSDLEYGRMVETFLKAENVAPAGMSSGEVPTIVQDDGDPIFGNHAYRPVQTKVADVLDRGLLMVSSREEVRLRGVRIGSERSPDDVSRVYAREAMKRIRDLAQDETVTLILDSPLRDSDGAILVVALLKDGTDLNKLLIKEGLGQLRAEDFADDVNFEPLAQAEKDARAKKRGIWSRNFGNSAL